MSTSAPPPGGPLPPPQGPPPPTYAPPGSGGTYGAYSNPRPEFLPPPSKAMAGWALGLSIIFCWGVALVVSVVLAIIVLARSSDGRDHGKRLAIAALVIDGIWILVMIGLVVSGVLKEWTDLTEDPTRDSSGQVTDVDEVLVTKLRTGDCFNDPALMKADEEMVDALTVTLVPCKRSHDLEVYEDFMLTGGEYPGLEEVEGQAAEGCLREFQGFVGKAYARSELEMFMYYPVERNWDLLDDHMVTCAVGDPGKRTTGTLKNARR